MTFDIGSLTDVGRRRSGNEDALDVLPLTDGTLCVVADGMGGHQAGEVASRMAVDTIRAAAQGDWHDAPEMLVGAIRAANRAIFEAAEADLARHGMGTTVVCGLLRDGRALLANVGDSPAFLVQGDQARQATRDHSWVAEERARGAITEAEAAVHPYRHILTRCLGTSEEIEVDLYDPIELQPGDVLVLCSDGLSEHVGPDDLGSAVAGRSAQAAAEHLVALANERGGSDNISVVVARWT